MKMQRNTLIVYEKTDSLLQGVQEENDQNADHLLAKERWNLAHRWHTVLCQGEFGTY
jgi:hypothetical protein